MRGRGVRQRRTPPLFPIDSWNVHLRTDSEMPRTNNHLEGYHNALQSSLSCIHPNIWKFINGLKKEEHLAQLKKIQFDGGEICEKKKKYKDINKRLQTIIERYSDQNKTGFLRAIAHNLHHY